MKILLVEDDSDKRGKIKEYIFVTVNKDPIIVERESLRSGLKEIILHGKEYDIVLLDMSMPSFDVGADEPGGGMPESFAGAELMEQMKLRSISIPVIVITQYVSFEGGRITLDELSKKFQSKFEDFYVGSVYYNSAVDGWKKELSTYLSQIIEY